MKKYLPIGSLLVFILLGLFLASCGNPPDNSNSDQVVLGGNTFKLSSGNNLNGNLLVMGGAATIEKGSRVNGDIAVFGGSLDVNGAVDGQITGAGGTISLGDQAEVSGDVHTIGTILARSSNATIRGQVIDVPRASISVPAAAIPDIARTWNKFLPVKDVIWAIIRSLALAAIAMLVVMFLPNATGRVGSAIIRRPFLAGGIGLLTLVVAPALILLLVITILLLPLGLIGALLILLAVLFGWIALGLEAGRRMSDSFRGGWSLPVSAGLGTLLLALVSETSRLVPCIGWLLPVIIGLLGLGGVLITRFGTRSVFPYDLPSTPGPFPATPGSFAAVEATPFVAAQPDHLPSTPDGLPASETGGDYKQNGTADSPQTQPDAPVEKPKTARRIRTKPTNADGSGNNLV